MPYRFLEDVALADIAIEATGKTLGELFGSAAMAISEQTVDMETVAQREKRTLALSSDTLEHLFYDFLSELLYIKDTDGFIFSSVEAKVSERPCEMKAVLSGERIDRKRHGLRNDIKAVTLHMFSVRKSAGGWLARFVVDI